METATLVPVQEYLNTSYADGDREYVDGVIVERNVGEIEHARVQTRIAAYIILHYEQFWAAVEVRVQVASTRFRVPDVSIVHGPEPQGRIITQPPLAVAEILSPDDRAGELQEKIDDYLNFGVRYVWVINPRTRKAFIYTQDSILEVKDGFLRTENPDMQVPLEFLFIPR
jgi:Uma2 family endonuclease